MIIQLVPSSGKAQNL